MSKNDITNQLQALANTYKSIVASAQTTSTSSTIKGSVGEGGKNDKADVLVVQGLLKNSHGYSIVVDGDCGPKTIAAIKDFQSKKMGTKNPDGRVDVGGATWTALNKKAATPAPTTPTTPSATNIKGSVGEGGKNDKADVLVVQGLLKNSHGYSIVVDGDCGPKTIAAIKDFQSKKMGTKNPDGRVDVGGATWTALNKKAAAPAPTTPTTPTPTTPPSTSNNSYPTVTPTGTEISASVGNNGVNKNNDVAIVQALFNKNYKANLPLTGIKGLSKTIDAIIRFQFQVMGTSAPDGRIDKGGATWKKLLASTGTLSDKAPTNKYIKPLDNPITVTQNGIEITTAAPGVAPAKPEHSDYVAAAKKYGVEVAVIYAIMQVESGGNGYFSDGRPKILFEGHHFRRLLLEQKVDINKYLPQYDNIIYPYDKALVRTKYIGGTAEYSRLENAMTIDAEAALKSASWGEGQVMGFNFATLGYKNVFEMVKDIQTRGSSGLDSIMMFCKNNNLLRHVQGSSKNWAALAKGYNGADYAANSYDTKLAKAYEEAKKKYP